MKVVHQGTRLYIVALVLELKEEDIELRVTVDYRAREGSRLARFGSDGLIEVGSPGWPAEIDILHISEANSTFSREDLRSEIEKLENQIISTISDYIEEG